MNRDLLRAVSALRPPSRYIIVLWRSAGCPPDPCGGRTSDARARAGGRGLIIGGPRLPLLACCSLSAAVDGAAAFRSWPLSSTAARSAASAAAAWLPALAGARRSRPVSPLVLRAAVRFTISGRGRGGLPSAICFGAALIAGAARRRGRHPGAQCRLARRARDWGRWPSSRRCALLGAARTAAPAPDPCAGPALLSAARSAPPPLQPCDMP
jgi:hypothetical protein